MNWKFERVNERFNEIGYKSGEFEEMLKNWGKYCAKCGWNARGDVQVPLLGNFDLFWNKFINNE